MRSSRCFWWSCGASRNTVLYRTYNQPGTIFSQSPETPSKPDDWQKMSVTVEGNTGALMTTLATALLGGIGWLMFGAPKAAIRRDMWVGFLAALCAAVSLSFGAISQGHLLFMLSNKNFNPYDPAYVFYNQGQFITLGLGAFLLAGFAFHGQSPGGSHAKHQMRSNDDNTLSHPPGSGAA